MKPPPTDEELASATLALDPTATPVPPEQRFIVAPPSRPIAPDAPLPISLPPEEADAILFDEAVRKRMAAAMLDDRSARALVEGLTAADLKERRLWWQMALSVTGARHVEKGGGDAGGVHIHLPAVGGPTIDVTPNK